MGELDGSSHVGEVPPQTHDIELSEQVPLVVDVDGTLIKTDLLLESIVRLLRRNFLFLFLLPVWLARGKAVLKAEVAQRVSLDAELLPYNRRFLTFLHDQHARGRRLVLATASHRQLVQGVAAHLGIFSEVFATDVGRNLAGRRKLEALVARFGHAGFDYAANARPDLAIWPAARCAILVNPEFGVQSRARAIARVETVFREKRPGVIVLAKALRVHQWIKNLLVFVPVLTAHALNDPHALLQAALGFTAFCAGASAVYLVNDALDLDADRAHPRKRNRPLAAGDLSLVRGALYTVVLFTSALALGAAVSVEFLGVLVAYLVLTTAYSFHLKTYVLIDVLCLAALYTLRVIAGAIAIAVIPSFWLLAFSMFVFLSLALVKRCAELHGVRAARGDSARGRDYSVVDLRQLTSLGTAAANGAVVILAMYINSPEVVRQYAHPELLWLLCPLLMYWTSRMWIKCGRGQMHDDPIVFSATDKASWVVGLLSGALVLIAT